MKPSEKSFQIAFARFRAANDTAQALSTKRDDAAARLLQAKLDAAGLQSRIEAFATSADPSVKNATELAAQLAQSGNVVTLLEQALDHLHRELALAKADVILAERACLDVQADHHDQTLAVMADDWLLANADALQKLTQQLHAAALFQLAKSDGFTTARNFAARHVEQLFENYLPAAIARVFGNDERFRAGCVAALPLAIAQPVESAIVTSAERTVAIEARSADRHNVASALAA